MNRNLLASLLTLTFWSAQGRTPVGAIEKVSGTWLVDSLPLRHGASALFAASRIRRDPSGTQRPRDFIEGRVGGFPFRLDCRIPVACDTGYVVSTPRTGNIRQLRPFQRLALVVGDSLLVRFLSVQGSLAAEASLEDGIVPAAGASTNLGRLVRGSSAGLVLTACPLTTTTSCEPEDDHAPRCTVARGTCQVPLRPGRYALRMFRTSRRDGALQYVASGELPALVLVLDPLEAETATRELADMRADADSWAVPPAPEQWQLYRKVFLLSHPVPPAR